MKVIATSIFLLAGLSSLAQAPKTQEPEAFTNLKYLVGGTWRGSVGENMPVEVKFTFAADGKVIESEGIVGDPKKPVLKMRARVGIDPITNKVFYLDEHNGTTIYFGHVTMEGKQAIFDFTALAGDKGHWRAKQTKTGDDGYESVLYVVGDDGKETALHPLHLKRTK